MENEIWKDIPNYDGKYQASNLGEIRSLKSAEVKILKQITNKFGYNVLTLCNNNKKSTKKVHRMVMYAFFGYSNLTVNHKNGIKTDNRLENLEYMTLSENNRHAQKMGLRDKANLVAAAIGKTKIGEKNNNAILTNEKIDRIRYLYETNEYSQMELSKLFGVSQTHIGRIIRFEVWK